jgi:hypothetical protein
MVVKELMGWVASQKRWVKKYRGKQYFVSPRQLGIKDSTKETSRTAANEWWKRKLESIEAAPADSRQESWPSLRRKELADLHRSNGDVAAAKKVEAQSDKEIRNGFASQLADKIVAHKLGIDLDAIERVAVLEDRKTRNPADRNRTVRFHATEFLKHKETQAIAGVLSVGRWGALKTHIQIFQDWIGGDSAIDGITSQKVKGFYHHLLESTDWTGVYKSTVFVSGKSFIRSLARDELIPLPSNLDSKDFRFPDNAKKIKTFTVDELKALLAAGSERVRLYLLLMMNCGYYQKDISDLQHDEVDWKKGRIKRKRSKTEQHDEVPTVDYPLWKETFRLLKRHRSQDKDRVFLTSESKPLKQESIVAGVLVKTDNIQSAYRRLQDKMKLKPSQRKPLKLIRKTSANLLDSNKDYARYVSHFLGHAPQSMKDKHYTSGSVAIFDEAVKWLGKQYGY